MKMKIIAVGKKHQGWAQSAEADFVSRIRNFSEISIELAAPADENSLGMEKVRKQEAEKILSKITGDDFVIACEREGKAFSSEEFAHKLGDLRDESRQIVFVIGGSNGLDQSVLDRADMQVSFSSMTFPHELFRVMLLEQIYRSLMILGNRKYHK